MIYTSDYDMVEVPELSKFTLDPWGGKVKLPYATELLPSRKSFLLLTKGIYNDGRFMRVYNHELFQRDPEVVADGLSKLANGNDILLISSHSIIRNCINYYFTHNYIKCQEYGGKVLSDRDWLTQLSGEADNNCDLCPD
jgi:hypothetical protein